MNDTLRILAANFGRMYKIDPALLLALIMVESSGRTFATRFEPHVSPSYLSMLSTFAQATGVSVETERMQQATSWGLLQVMGFTARELGHRGLLPELCQSEVGLELGCKYLKKQQAKFGKPKDGVLGWDEAVVASYNAGSPRHNPLGKWKNQGYVDKVKAAYALGAGKS